MSVHWKMITTLGRNQEILLKLLIVDEVTRDRILRPKTVWDIFLFDGYRRIFGLTKKRHSEGLSMSKGKNVNTLDTALYHGPGTGIKSRSCCKYIIYNDITIVRFNFGSWIYFKS